MKNMNMTDYEKEGLNSVNYELFETIITPLYTKFLVYYDEEEYMENLRARINLTAGLEEEKEYWRQKKFDRLKNKIESRTGLQSDDITILHQLNATYNYTLEVYNMTSINQTEITSLRIKNITKNDSLKQGGTNNLPKKSVNVTLDSNKSVSSKGNVTKTELKKQNVH
jgi:hypothetical protein